MEITRRRQTLGKHASAALPKVWKAVAAKGWWHATLAKHLVVRRRQGSGGPGDVRRITNGELSRVLYGDVEPSIDLVLQMQKLLDVEPVLWTKPVPPNWRPHAYPAQRTRARRESGSGAELQELTGTDD